MKATATDVYTKTQSDSSLALKANVSDVYSKTLVDSFLALKANANNADITGYIKTNNLKLLGVPTTSSTYDNSKGLLIHPNGIRLAISSLDTPLTGESVIVADNTSVVLNREYLLHKKADWAKCLLLGRHYGINKSQRSRKYDC